MQNNLIGVDCTAFLGVRVVTSGSLQDVVSTAKESLDDSQLTQLLIFNDASGEQIDVDFRGTKDDVINRLTQRHTNLSDTEPKDQRSRRAGRPRLGVVSGEVTLLPRHWDWLKSQPGGASVTLRKLVDEARRNRGKENEVRQTQETTYRFMTAMAGDFSHYEEALRALYAGDAERFQQLIEDWAPDIRDHIKKLAAKAFEENRGKGQ